MQVAGTSHLPVFASSKGLPESNRLGIIQLLTGFPTKPIWPAHVPRLHQTDQRRRGTLQLVPGILDVRDHLTRIARRPRRPQAFPTPRPLRHAPARRHARQVPREMRKNRR